MEFRLDLFVVLMVVAVGVVILATRLRLPHSVGLVLVGVALASLPFSADFPVTQHLLYLVLLPPLVFESAYQMKWSSLRRDFLVVLVLATAGVLVAALITASGMHWLVQWEWGSALAFGMLIAATDPVSVIAAFKEARIGGRSELLLVAESLFNDGTAAVGFSVVLMQATGQDVASHGVIGTTVIVIAGSLLCGAAASLMAVFFARFTEDHLLQITLATVAAYGAFLLAEHFHLSGILATLVSGLICGNTGTLSTRNPKGYEAISSVFEFMAFLANALIFMFIGMQCATHPFWTLLLPVACAIGLVLLGRVVTVYPLCALFHRTTLRVTAAHQHILVWGGLRGALALALALGLPQDFPHRDVIVSTTFAVVAFSIFVQGLTMPTALRRWTT